MGKILYVYVYISLLLFPLLDKYEMVNERYCTKRYGALSSLPLAKLACSSDIKCLGLYDHYCNNSGRYFLCDADSETKYSASGCIYRKLEYSGMCF